MQQDWRGTPDCLFRVLGASSHAIEPRQEVDFYATDPHTLEIFLDKLAVDNVKLPLNICEPSCGGGHLSETLKKRGFSVVSYDLYDHGYGITGQDFLKSEIKAECFLTNPPYKYSLEFVNHAIKNVMQGGLVVMLLRIQFLEGKKRNGFFKKYPPKYIYVHSSRQNCAKNGDFIKIEHSSAACYAWFIWEEGFKGETIVRWID